MNILYKHLIVIAIVYVHSFSLPDSLRVKVMNPVRVLKTQEMDSLFQMVKDDKYERRNFFTGISMKQDTSSQKARTAMPVVSASIRKSIVESASDNDPFLSSDAMSAAGRLKFREIRDVAIDRAMNASDINVMYDSHIRQAALFALLETGDSTLSGTFKELLSKRSNYWFNGDIEMILDGLSRFGDNTALPQLNDLHSRVVAFIGECSGEDKVYYKTRCEELKMRIEVAMRSVKGRKPK